MNYLNDYFIFKFGRMRKILIIIVVIICLLEFLCGCIEQSSSVVSDTFEDDEFIFITRKLVRDIFPVQCSNIEYVYNRISDDLEKLDNYTLSSRCNLMRGRLFSAISEIDYAYEQVFDYEKSCASTTVSASIHLANSYIELVQKNLEYT